MIDCHFGTDSKHFGINADNRHVELSKLLTHTSFQLLIAFIGHNLISAALLLLSRSLSLRKVVGFEILHEVKGIVYLHVTSLSFLLAIVLRPPYFECGIADTLALALDLLDDFHLQAIVIDKHVALADSIKELHRACVLVLNRSLLGYLLGSCFLLWCRERIGELLTCIVDVAKLETFFSVVSLIASPEHTTIVTRLSVLGHNVFWHEPNLMECAVTLSHTVSTCHEIGYTSFISCRLFLALYLVDVVLACLPCNIVAVPAFMPTRVALLLMGCLYLLRHGFCAVGESVALNSTICMMCHEDMLVLAMLLAPDGITTMETFFLFSNRLGCGKLHVFKCDRLRICHGFLVTKHGLGKLLCAVCITHEETAVVLAPPAFEVFSKLLCSVHLLLAKLTFKRHKLHI